jgi:hypothetical protein
MMGILAQVENGDTRNKNLMRPIRRPGFTIQLKIGFISNQWGETTCTQRGLVFFIWGGERCGWGSFAIWCLQMYTIQFLHVSHQVLNCSLLRSQFVPQVPNSGILYPISTFAQIPNYIGSPKKILHYVYFGSGKICLQHLYIIRPWCRLCMIYFRDLRKWALGV